MKKIFSEPQVDLMSLISPLSNDPTITPPDVDVGTGSNPDNWE